MQNTVVDLKPIVRSILNEEMKDAFNEITSNRILRMMLMVFGGQADAVAPSTTKVQMQLIQLIRDQVGNELAIRARTQAKIEAIHFRTEGPIDQAAVRREWPVHHLLLCDSLWATFVSQSDGSWRWQCDSDHACMVSLMSNINRSLQPTDARVMSLRYALESRLRSASMMLGVNPEWMGMMDHVKLFLAEWNKKQNGK